MKSSLIMIFFVLIGCSLSGQSSGSSDTLTLVGDLMAENSYKSAEILLSHYLVSHPEDVLALWLKGIALKNLNKTTQAKASYRKAVGLWPGLNELAIDYCRFLQESGQIFESYKEAKRLLSLDESNIQLLMIQARNYHWMGNAARSKNTIEEILILQPGYSPAQQLMHEVNMASALYLSIGSDYTKDNQPMNALHSSIESKIQITSGLAPKLEIDQYLHGHQGDWFGKLGSMFSNTFRISATSTGVTPGIGFYHYANTRTKGTSLWYGLTVQQQIHQRLNMTLQAGREPYLYNVSIIDTHLMNRYLDWSFTWNLPGKILAKTGYRADFFKDNNIISSGYAWGLATLIRSHIFQASIGYGISLSHANNSRFQSVLPLADLLTDTVANANPEGHFYPYFTPNQQQIHSLLCNLDFILSPAWLLQLKTSYGFYAVSQYPNLALEKNTTTDTYEVKTTWSKNTFHPYELKAMLRYKINERSSIHSGYSISRNNYYSDSRFFVKLQFLIGHE